jgi:acetone carboxylase gamma subunit
VFQDKLFGDWVFLEGKAEVVSLPAAMEPLVHYYPRLAREHDDWGEYRESMCREQRVILRVDATGAGPGRKG